MKLHQDNLRLTCLAKGMALALLPALFLEGQWRHLLAAHRASSVGTDFGCLRGSAVQ